MRAKSYEPPDREIDPDADSSVRRAFQLLAVVLGCIVLVGIAYCLFAVPIHDDFRRAINGRELGVIDGVLARRNNWSGRWMPIGFVMLIAGNFDLYTVYPFYLLALFSLFIGALHLMVALILGLHLHSKTTFFFTALIFCIYWNGMPSPGESFYWMTGAASEHLYFILSAIVLYQARTLLQGRRMLAVIGGAIAVFLASGGHSLYDLMLGFVLLLALAVSLIHKKELAIYWLIVGILLAIGFLVVATAPGNNIRAQYYVNYYIERNLDVPDVAQRLWFAVKHFCSHVIGWSTNAQVLGLTALLVFRPKALDYSAGWLSRLPLKVRVTLIFSGLVGLLLGYIGFALVAPGASYYPRMLNLFYLWFLLWWIFSLLALTRAERLMIPNRYLAGLCVFLGFSLLALGNFQPAVRQLADGTVFTFSGFLHYLDAQMKNSDPEDDVRISRIPVSPGILMEYRIGPDPTYRGNRWIAEYYGVRGLYVENLIGVPRTEIIEEPSNPESRFTEPPD